MHYYTLIFKLKFKEKKNYFFFYFCGMEIPLTRNIEYCDEYILFVFSVNIFVLFVLQIHILNMCVVCIRKKKMKTKQKTK